MTGMKFSPCHRQDWTGPAYSRPQAIEAVLADDESKHFFQDASPGSPTHKDVGAKPEPVKPASPHSGHRDRLRERFNTAGDAALADYELLEMFLFRTIRQGDTKPLAKRLLSEFGTLAAVMNAPLNRLMEVKGVGAAVANDLHLGSALAKRMARTAISDREVLSSWQSVLDYCTVTMAHEHREQFRILFLDKKNRLIADEVQQVGTVDHTPVYPREVMKRALELSASAIILLHNHPSGDPTPSRADIDMTRTIEEVANTLNIVVHDHVIIAKTGHASLRGLGYMN